MPASLAALDSMCSVVTRQMGGKTDRAISLGQTHCAVVFVHNALHLVYSTATCLVPCRLLIIRQTLYLLRDFPGVCHCASRVFNMFITQRVFIGRCEASIGTTCASLAARGGAVCDGVCCRGWRNAAVAFGDVDYTTWLVVARAGGGAILLWPADFICVRHIAHGKQRLSCRGRLSSLHTPLHTYSYERGLHRRHRRDNAP